MRRPLLVAPDCALDDETLEWVRAFSPVWNRNRERSGTNVLGLSLRASGNYEEPRTGRSQETAGNEFDLTAEREFRKEFFQGYTKTGGGIPHRFARVAGPDLDAIAFHSYWLGPGTDARAIERRVLDHGEGAEGGGDAWPPEDLSRSVRAHRAAAGGRPVWATEGGGAWGSGAEFVSDRFLSAFWCLDELGTFAREGVAVSCRRAPARKPTVGIWGTTPLNS